MCGRYLSTDDIEMQQVINILSDIQTDLPKTEIEKLSNKKIEIRPTNIAPVIYEKDGKININLFKWGFEKWDGKGVIINAKSENAENGNFFSPYTKNNRCIIPAHSYFEWQTLPDKKKIKYEFNCNMPYGIFMGGLYRESNNEFVILTKNAEPNISFIHNRMPLILNPQKIWEWLCASQNIIYYSKDYINLSFKEATKIYSN